MTLSQGSPQCERTPQKVTLHAISGCKSEFILTSVLPACPHAERHVSVSTHMFPVGLPPPMGRRAQKHVPAAPVPYVGARASKIRYFTWYESAGRQEQARRDSETLPMPAGDGRKWEDRWREYSTTFSKPSHWPTTVALGCWRGDLEKSCTVLPPTVPPLAPITSGYGKRQRISPSLLLPGGLRSHTT